MTAAQQSEAVRADRATLRQMVEGLLNGPDELGRACKQVLTRTDASLKELTDTQLPGQGCADGDFAGGAIDHQFEQKDTFRQCIYKFHPRANCYSLGLQFQNC